ncbi:sirohydrochlorin cobaltochelatase [Aminipila butyrica]|uniref:Sirohydrochlorin cobaltochelatase n=1 Tax=Aminipila butyrica TaxID=433296 RepID=A0A858BU64_9FIRM|nr:sirohydrochlorin cobaltochelatase [Aminipila butyrica]QIB68882.1 sirohydrochlorin cobaltochelatase [Aminipila butyrica]
MSKKEALLVVSFGTSHQETREKTIGQIERVISKAYPNRELRRAFTSSIIMRVLKKRDQLHVDNVTEALERLAADGFTDVLIQPTHIINGDEYEKMMGQIEPFIEQFETIAVGRALLTSSEDYDLVCRAIMAEVPELDGTSGGQQAENTALVLMGHGTGHFCDAAYAALDYRFKSLGYGNVFVGTVEGYPDVERVLELVRLYGPQQVVLMPFMVVAGDHAVNDMAGEEEDSWKIIFQQAGYDVSCILRGIGEFPGIQQLYLDHASTCEPLGQEME